MNFVFLEQFCKPKLGCSFGWVTWAWFALYQLKLESSHVVIKLHSGMFIHAFTTCNYLSSITMFYHFYN